MNREGAINASMDKTVRGNFCGKHSSWSWHKLHVIWCIYILHLFFYPWLLCLIKRLSLQCNSKIENMLQCDAFPGQALGGPVVPLVCGFIGWDNLLAWLELFTNLYELKSCIWFKEEYIHFWANFTSQNIPGIMKNGVTRKLQLDT